MAQDNRKNTTPRQSAKRSEPPAEHALGVVKSLSVGKASRFNTHWQIHGIKGAATKRKRQTKKSGWQQDKIHEALRTLYPPDGQAPNNLTDKQVLRLVEPIFEKNGWKSPKRDSIARARGRRKKRG